VYTPATRSYSNVSTNQSAQDYSAANFTYFVTGTISVNGLPLANVALAAANGGVCSPSNAWGQYSCAVAPGWSGTVTPSATGYSFAPASRSLTSVGADQSAQDFAATLQSASAPMFFIHVDHLDTPRLVADQQGQPVWRWNQEEPFGNNVPEENPSGLGAFELPLRFAGQYFDKETNLHYNYFRNYDPSLARYGQSDPIGLEGGMNTYAYVAGSPLTHVDPLGLYMTTVQAYCMRFPSDCTEMMADMIENASRIQNGCVAEEAAQTADNFRDIGSISAILSGIGAVKKIGGAAEKAAENRAKSRARGVPDSAIGPSGLPKTHTAEHSTRKAAKEAAERDVPAGGGSVRHDAHPSNTKQGPHFQAEDADGKNAYPVVHHEYPKSKR
jgi:RHS repeat-associated protein